MSAARECGICDGEVTDPNESQCGECLSRDEPYRPKQLQLTNDEINGRYERNTDRRFIATSDQSFSGARRVGICAQSERARRNRTASSVVGSGIQNKMTGETFP